MLSGLWVGVFTLPANLALIEGTSVVNFLKIIALFSTMETLGYLGTRLAGAKRGLLIQGLCGGFISSTMTYLRITRNPQLAAYAPKVLAQALLLSTVAMLFESIFIIYTLHPQATQLIAPLVVQILFLTLATLAYHPWGSRTPLADAVEVAENDDPIIWKKMVYLSLFIIALTYTMRFISRTLHLPYTWSALLVSLFEAHGVLVAAMTEFRTIADLPRAAEVVLAISAGNVLSKTFFVLRSKRKDIRIPTLGPLYLSLLIAVLVGLYF